MKILLPTEVTSAMIGAGTTIPALDAGEVAWTAGAYTVGDERVDDGAIYSCVKAHTSAAGAPTPKADAVNWLYKSPTNRMAPFDEYLYTRARRQGSLTYVLNPGFCTGFALYGMEADSISYTLRDAPGGAILAQETLPMWAQAFGEWEYLFGNLQRTTHLVRAGLPMRPEAQLEITLTRNDPGVHAELGMLMVGQWRELLAPGSGSMGGTEYGVEVTPKSYSYFKRNDDGTYTRRQGRTAKQITASVMIAATEAPRVAALLEKIIDTPVAVEASSLPRYGHISTVGFVTGSIVSQSYGIAMVNLKVDGNI